MVKKFKNTLKGNRITLKATKPSIKFAQIMFNLVDLNREHLSPWLSWEKLTKKVEDSLKYLFDKEEKTKKGKKIEYGIYHNKKYLGNIAIFDIDEDNKSAEIGYWLDKKSTRKGYMTEAVKILEDEFFKNFKLNRIQIRCDKENKASVGVAKKCGYKFEGTSRKVNFNKNLNEFRDGLTFSKLRSEWEEDN